MKAYTLFLGALVLAVCGLLALHLHLNLHFKFNLGQSAAERGGMVGQLTDMIRMQNQSINLLEGALASKTKVPGGLSHLIPERESEERIRVLMGEVKELQGRLKERDSGSSSSSSSSSIFSKLLTPHTPQTHQTPPIVEGGVALGGLGGVFSLVPPKGGMDKECSARYGMELIDAWRKKGEVWCEGEGPVKSRLICYPYHQAHKVLDGRGPDLFCEAENFIVDSSKIKGESSSKPPKGDQYLHFERGSLLSSCKKTSKFQGHLFMPHHQLQMQSFLDSQATPSEDTYDVERTPTYLLARDEDCENSFHSTADFMNMFLVMSALDIHPAALQVMLFDKHKDGPYLELIQKAYSPSHPVVRHEHYQGKKVMFERLVFHLESPAGLIFPKVSRPDPMRCRDMGLFQGYRKFVLNAFDLLNVMPPALPTVTLTLRHRTAEKNVGRVLKNEQEVVDVLKEGNMMNLNVVDTSRMSFAEQLRVVRATNILVGVHGAGLMFIMFAAEEAILVEMHPSYRQDRHFRHAARLTGKVYMPLRSQQREMCVGSSDNVVIPISEFRILMDGAVRVARSFDDGLSECGLTCPLPILALDNRLDPLYGDQKMVKGRAIDTRFPCY